MMRTKLTFGLVLAAAVLAAASTGCVAVVAGAAGAGTVAWVRGRLDATLNSNYEKTVNATDLAIKDLQYAKVSEKKDALEAFFIARTAGDRKVDITVRKSTDESTKVEIRVGVFGDEALSLTVLDKIKANL